MSDPERPDEFAEVREALLLESKDRYWWMKACRNLLTAHDVLAERVRELEAVAAMAALLTGERRRLEGGAKNLLQEHETLKAKIAQLQAENEQLSADAQRIDWMAANAMRYQGERLAILLDPPQQNRPGNTFLRDAIDETRCPHRNNPPAQGCALRDEKEAP